MTEEKWTEFSVYLFLPPCFITCVFPPLRISEWLIDIVKLHKQQDSGRCLRTTRSVLIHVNILGDDSLSRKHFEADTTVLRTHKCILGCTILSKNRNQNNTCQSSFVLIVGTDALIVGIDTVHLACTVHSKNDIKDLNCRDRFREQGYFLDSPQSPPCF